MAPSAVTVVGAGGIGCAIGYALCHARVAVTFVEAEPARVHWGRRHGVQVAGRPALPAAFVPFADWSPSPGQRVLLCVKCYDNLPVLERLVPGIDLIPIQNGFDPMLDRQGHPLEGIASFVSEANHRQSFTRITRPGDLHLGPRPGAEFDPATAQELASTLRRAGLFRVVVVPNILGFKYAKLLYNAAIGPLAAAAGLDNGQLLFRPGLRRLFFALLRENHAILKAAGKPLHRIGPFHPDTVQRILARPWLAHALAWAFYPSLRGTYCSMAGDLARGRTEIEHYNGHLLDLAGDLPCPLNRRVVELVKRLEIERAPIEADQLVDLIEPGCAKIAK